MNTCLNCSTSIIKSRTYCSNKCQGEFNKNQRIQKWLNNEWSGTVKHDLSQTIKDFLYKEANYTCSLCPWNTVNSYTGKVPLEIDHIDGDWKNNHPSNLRVLCPNCHSLTQTYKAGNMGKGRTHRKEYKQFEGKPNLAIKIEHHCSCGKLINKKGICYDCFKKDRRKQSDNTYPDIHAVVQNVKEKGYRAYGKEIGKTDNAIRKFLKRNNIEL